MLVFHRQHRCSVVHQFTAISWFGASQSLSQYKTHTCKWSYYQWTIVCGSWSLYCPMQRYISLSLSVSSQLSLQFARQYFGTVCVPDCAFRLRYKSYQWPLAFTNLSMNRGKFKDARNIYIYIYIYIIYIYNIYIYNIYIYIYIYI